MNDLRLEGCWSHGHLSKQGDVHCHVQSTMVKHLTGLRLLRTDRVSSVSEDGAVLTTTFGGRRNT